VIVGERILWVSDTPSLSKVVHAIGGGPLALDTEADSFHHYREKVCLAQISFGDEDVVVDPLAGADLRVLGPVLQDRGILKVLHGADYDLRILYRDYGLEVRGLFDTMVAARFVGDLAYGLAALLESYLGIRLDKSHQRDDWSRRPLPPSMLAYAAADTRHLLELHEVLAGKLEALGRKEWAEEEFRRLESVRWSDDEPDEEAFRSVKGAQALDRKGLAVLRALFSWRDAIARERDVPLFRVVGNATLLALAKAQPRTEEDLRKTEGFPRGFAVPHRARAILEIIARAADLPEASLPARSILKRARPDPAFEAELKALKERRDQVAKGLGLDPGLVANRSLLEGILARRRRGEPVTDLPELRRWQAGVLADIL
jgi:ribonuclease D